jgi:hypothetical protein
MKMNTVLNVKYSGCATTLRSRLKDDFDDVSVNLDVNPQIIMITQTNINEALLNKTNRAWLSYDR